MEQATKTQTTGTISIREASRTLGISYDSVQRSCERGELRYGRIGRRILIARADVEQLLRGVIGDAGLIENGGGSLYEHRGE